MSTSNSMIEIPVDTIFNTPTIKLAPLTILTGYNNTGKTTILKNIIQEWYPLKKYYEWHPLRKYYFKYCKWEECSSFLFDIGQTIFNCDLNILEQPECGLHPIAQLEIADKIIELAHRSLFTIVETHSDHIINRLTRRSVEGVVSDKDMLIYHLTRESTQKTKIKQVFIDKNEGAICEDRSFFYQFAEESEPILDECFNNMQKEKS